MAIIEEITDSCESGRLFEKPALIANNHGNDDQLAELRFLRTQNAQYAAELDLKNAEIRELRRGGLVQDINWETTTTKSNDSSFCNAILKNIV